MRRAYDEKTGTEYVIREILMPAIERSYRDLLAACAGAALVIGHPIVYSVPLAAEQLRIPWLSVTLQPAGLFSAYDPPFFPRAAWLYGLRRLGHWPFALVFSLAKRQAKAWGEPVLELRRRVGLPAPVASPMLEGSFSPAGTMAWFSSVLGAPQPDWPPLTRQTGFPFYDRLDPGHCLPAPLDAFLRGGEPPVVFTLGSSAVLNAGDFYHQSLAAVQALGCRAVFLTGMNGINQLPVPLPGSIAVADYAPYSELFPRARAIVHQGGIGTTAQALRSGRPMLVVPFSHDQPDNARRCARLGVARILPSRRYTAARAAGELRALLSDSRYGAAAAAAGRTVSAEDGVTAACDAIASALR
jgi:UDP:flavonoid glycosyltransferase YjiC (YdhE family)